MIPCFACGCHFRLADPACPHCSAPRRGVPRTASAVMLGLLAASCSGKDLGATDSGTTDTDTVTEVQPLYGVTTTTDFVGDADTDADSDADADADADADSDADADTGTTGGSGSTVEPLYGVVTGGSGR